MELSIINIKLLLALEVQFSPLKNLGLIVVDEEQESSFRQKTHHLDTMPEMLPFVRGKKSNALVFCFPVLHQV